MTETVDRQKFKGEVKRITKKELHELSDRPEVRKKIAKANSFIFQHLEEEGFSIFETKLLICSIGETLREKTWIDPLSKLSDF